MSAGTPAPHVLVLEDDQATLGLYRDLLLDGGYAVTLWSHPPAEPAEVARVNPDLILLDLVFEGKEQGWSFVHAIRQDPATAEIPVLVCTAAAQLVDRLRTDLEAASCGIVLKPFDIDDILAAIAACLARRERSRDAG